MVSRWAINADQTDWRGEGTHNTLGLPTPNYSIGGGGCVRDFPMRVQLLQRLAEEYKQGRHFCSPRRDNKARG